MSFRARRRPCCSSRRRALALGLATAALAACGGSGDVAEPARPQLVRIGWDERCNVGGWRVRTAVQTLVVRRRSWTVEATVENASRAVIAVSAVHSRTGALFGLAGYATPSRREVLERATRLAAKPHLVATRFRPPLPRVLYPGDRWRGRFSGPGPLTRGHYVRVVLGRFHALNRPLRTYYLCISKPFRLR